MKTTTIVDFELGMALVLVEPDAYQFDFEATQEALNIMHNLRMSLASEPGIGWNILYRAKRHLENEMTNHFLPGE